MPGFEKKRGRYLLSLTNAAESVGRPARSIFEFLQLNGFKALLGARFEFSDFAVENAQKPIVGIPPEIATIYWTYQLSKGNMEAFALVSTFNLTSLEHFADLEFGIDRTKVEQITRMYELFWKFEAGTYAPHFQQEYYDELYRVLRIEKKPGRSGRPKLFSDVTRNYFYQLMPGGVNDLFAEIKKSKDEYWHQFLTSGGEVQFKLAMTSFLTFLRGLHPCSWDSFVAHYNNTYGKGFQRQLDLFAGAA